MFVWSSNMQRIVVVPSESDANSICNRDVSICTEILHRDIEELSIIEELQSAARSPSILQEEADQLHATCRSGHRELLSIPPSVAWSTITLTRASKCIEGKVLVALVGGAPALLQLY